MGETPVYKKIINSILFARRLSISLKVTTFQINIITVTKNSLYLNSYTMHNISSK